MKLRMINVALGSLVLGVSLGVNAAIVTTTVTFTAQNFQDNDFGVAAPDNFISGSYQVTYDNSADVVESTLDSISLNINGFEYDTSNVRFDFSDNTVNGPFEGLSIGGTVDLSAITSTPNLAGSFFGFGGVNDFVFFIEDDISSFAYVVPEIQSTGQAQGFARWISGGFSGQTGDLIYKVDTVSAVPLPAAAWLFISALGGLSILRYKNQ